MDWLERERPELVGRYGELYARGAYAPADERRRLAALVRGDRPRGAAPRFGRRRPRAAAGAGARVEHARAASRSRRSSLF